MWSRGAIRWCQGLSLPPLLSIVAAAGLGACGKAATGSSPRPAPDVLAPLATAIAGAGATWATVPMGELSQPSNKFWQLFSRQAGKTTWADKVAATATATNGGLVLAAAPGRLVVAVRPSGRLHYTPLIETSDAGRNWSDGLIEAPVAPYPDALALTGQGRGSKALALTEGGPGGTRVLSSPRGDLSSWGVLVTERVLSATPAGRSCGLRSLSGVAYEAGEPLVGGNCSHGGHIGLFGLAQGHWHLVGPSLPGSLRTGRTEVVALYEPSSGRLALPALSALLAVAAGGHTYLVALVAAHQPVRKGSPRQAPTLWTTSPPLPLLPGERLLSAGAATGGYPFLLLQAVKEKTVLAVAGQGGWRQLPAPPPGTATVAFGGPAVTALAATGDTLGVFELRGSSWAKAQKLQVQVLLGSSG
jgi:hypothetical protein